MFEHIVKGAPWFVVATYAVATFKTLTLALGVAPGTWGDSGSGFAVSDVLEIKFGERGAYEISNSNKTARLML